MRPGDAAEDVGLPVHHVEWHGRPNQRGPSFSTVQDRFLCHTEYVLCFYDKGWLWTFCTSREWSTRTGRMPLT